MVSVTGFTAARMLAMEAATVVRGVVEGNNLVLYRRDGTPIDAGSVRGPIGPKGDPGSITVSPAGGALTGNFPNPGIAAKVITDASVADANVDGEPGTPSMRTLGDGAQQAAAGDHDHGDTGWVDCTAVAGDAPFNNRPATLLQYRKRGQLVHVRVAKTMQGSVDRSTNSNGNFGNVNIVGVGSIPTVARPVDQGVHGSARLGDTPIGVVLSTTGAIVWTGGFPRNYTAGLTFYADFVYYTDA